MTTKEDNDSPKARRQAAGLALSNCMFSQYFGTFGMLFAVGVPVSIRAKNYWPAVTAGLVGTVLDFAYGYNFACASLVNDYRRAAEVPYSQSVIFASHITRVLTFDFNSKFIGSYN